MKGTGGGQGDRLGAHTHTPEAKLMSTVIPLADLLSFHLFLNSTNAER